MQQLQHLQHLQHILARLEGEVTEKVLLTRHLVGWAAFQIGGKALGVVVDLCRG